MGYGLQKGAVQHDGNFPHYSNEGDGIGVKFQEACDPETKSERIKIILSQSNDRIWKMAKGSPYHDSYKAIIDKCNERLGC